ncbi:MAG TPA: CPBP family intramembrane glutamic endopeptidase [Coriobacteriia bacterium]|jgi:membrane protease YdiL (CAAX protease family)
MEAVAQPPLTSLRWSPAAVVALVVWAASLNVAQALALRALGVAEMPGELPHFIRAVVVFAYYAAILAPVVVSARRRQLRFTEAVGLHDGPWGVIAGLAFAAVFAARSAALLWAWIVVTLHLRLPGGAIDVSRVFGHSIAGILVTVAVTVIVGPFVEEVVFRGVAFAQLQRVQGLLGGVLGSSVLFGLLHINPLEFVPLVIAGALFAWLFHATRSLWSAVLAHSLFNLVAIVAVYAIRGVR